MNCRKTKGISTEESTEAVFAEIELPRSGGRLTVEFCETVRLLVDDSRGVKLAAELINTLCEEEQDAS